MSDLFDYYKEQFGLENAIFSKIEHPEAIIATVYKVSMPNGKEYVLKICARDIHYYCEVYFLTYFSDTLPTPHLIKFIKPTSGLNGAILIEYLQGYLLNKENLTDSLARESGSLLAKIHLNKFKAYGDITQPNKLSNDAYSYFNNKFEEGLNECKNTLPNELLIQCRIFYKEQVKFLDFVDGPCITHRDYRPSNVIVSNDKVQGIIDWSSGRASFAEEDFYPLYFGKWTDNDVLKKAFLEGYKSIRSVPLYENVMPLLGLNAAIAKLGFTFRSGTWKTRNAGLYQKERQFLEKLITDYFDKK